MVNSNVSKKGTLTKVLSVFLASLMIFSCFSICAFADTSIYGSGECGDNLKWVLTSDHVLTISLIDEAQPAGEMSFENGDSWSDLHLLVEQVVFPDGITNVCQNAFENCTSITSITLPESVTNIGSYAFLECSNLKSIILPDNLTKIGMGAFWNCSELTSISIPESTTEISGWTFIGCVKLETANIPKSMTTVPEQMFYNCPSLKAIEIPYGVTDIGAWAFYKCHSLTSIEIPDTVTNIGDYAFYDCLSLTGTLELPNYDTLTIGCDAFHNCGCRGGVDNMVQFFSNYGDDFYHFSDEIGTGSNTCASWSYDEYVCNDCGEIIPNDWTYSSNSTLLSDDVLFDNSDISLCPYIYDFGYSSAHTTATAEFTEIEQPATCTKNKSILIQMSDIYYEDGVKHVFAEKEVEIENTKLEHKAADAVIENCINDVINNDFLFDSVVYCSYNCNTELDRKTVTLTFVPETPATATADGMRAHYESVNGNKYLYDGSLYNIATDEDLVLHYVASAKHEADIYDISGTGSYYFYNNSYCVNCDELVSSEKVELVHHAKVLATDSTNGTTEYFTDANGVVWLWNSAECKYEMGTPKTLFGGIITADNVTCIKDSKTKIDFTYTGPSPEQNFVYKAASSYVTLTEDGYFISSGLNFSGVPFVEIYSQDGERLLGTIKGNCGCLIDCLNIDDVVLYLNNSYSTNYSPLQFRDANGVPTTLGTRSANSYYNSTLTAEIDDTSIAELKDKLYVSSTAANVEVKKIGQTTLTIKAENLTGTVDDYEKKVNVTVVLKPSSTVYIGKGESVDIRDYFKVPEGFVLPIESISTSDNSIVAVSEDGTVTGVLKGSTTIDVNGNSITVSVYNPATTFDAPLDVVYSTGEDEYYIPFIIDKDADYRSGLEYEVVSKPETADVKVKTESGRSDEAIKGLDFDYDSWEEDSYCAAFYLDWEDDTVAGDYVIRVWPKGNKNLAKDINITVLNSADYFGVTSEQTTLNFKYDNDTYLWYAVDENDNKLSGYTANYLADNVYVIMTSDSAYSQEDLSNLTLQEIDVNCNVARKSAASDNYYGYANFVGSCYGFDYDSCLGVTSDGYLVYINYYYDDERVVSQDTYCQITWAACYSENIIENKNSFAWSSADGWFVEVDQEGKPVDYSETVLEAGKEYYCNYGGVVGACLCMNADSLTEKEKAWMLEDVGFIPAGNYIAYPDDYYPMFFLNDQNHLCLAEEYGEDEYEDNAPYDCPLYSCSTSEQIISIENGEVFDFNLIIQTLDSDVDDFTITLSDPDMLAVNNTTVTGKHVGTTQAVIKAFAQVPSSDHREVETVELTKTISFNVYGCSTDDLVLVPGEKLSLNFDTTSDEEVVFTSSNEDVATVSDNGEVTAGDAGIATITAECGEFSDTAEIVVVETFVNTPNSVSEENGEVEANCSAPEDMYTIEYSSSDESVATVDSDGNITMHGTGMSTITTNITVRAGDATRTFTYTEVVEFCNHTPGEIVIENEIPATCVTDGSYDEVVYCTDEGCNYEISRTHKIVAATGVHAWQEAGRSNEVDVSCVVEGGYDTNYKCANCDATKSEHTTIPATGHNDGDTNGYCDTCGEIMPGTGGTVVISKGGSDIYYYSTDKVNWKTVTGNSVVSCPNGIMYLRLCDRDTGSYKFVVNGSDVPFDDDGVATLKVSGAVIVTPVPTIVPDVEESLTIFQKIANFFKQLAEFFRNLFK